MSNAAITNAMPWTEIGSGWAAAVTTPAVSGRKYDTVKATTGVYVLEPDGLYNALELAFAGTTDGDSLVFDILAARGTGDYFTRIATVTCTVGTMQLGSATKLAADTIALSNVAWPTGKIEAVSDANNYRAKVWLDRMGYHSFVVIPTTVAHTAYAAYSGV